MEILKKKACKDCKVFVDGDICPICKKGSFSNNWQGRIHFINTKKSMIAHKMGVDKKGEYAIKVR
ncbi:MAG: transcription elongation factor subunit Spt4 [archaeon]